MNKLKAIWSLIWSRNWLVIDDRNSSSSVRYMYIDAFVDELKDYQIRFRQSQLKRTQSPKGKE